MDMAIGWIMGSEWSLAGSQDRKMVIGWVTGSEWSLAGHWIVAQTSGMRLNKLPEQIQRYNSYLAGQFDRGEADQ